MNTYKGHILDKNNKFVDAKSNAGWCGFCGKEDTLEGHDACLGTLPHPTMNACCGHGMEGDAYVQFQDKTDLRGTEAILYFKKHNKKT